jgi:Divergent 4Fe-4S mono-cluster
VRGLPAVFDTEWRQWNLPDGADPEEVVRTVARCPTGALRTHPITTTTGEQPLTPTEATTVAGGPLLLRGDLHVTGAGGVDERETRAALC